MSGPESNQHPLPAGNPSDDYPPTRPGPIVIVVALALIVAGLSIENWSDLSSLVHVTQIEKALGL